jgi:hypothetical protein
MVITASSEVRLYKPSRNSDIGQQLRQPHRRDRIRIPRAAIAERTPRVLPSGPPRRTHQQDAIKRRANRKRFNGSD